MALVHGQWYGRDGVDGEETVGHAEIRYGSRDDRRETPFSLYASSSNAVAHGDLMRPKRDLVFIMSVPCHGEGRRHFCLMTKSPKILGERDYRRLVATISNFHTFYVHEWRTGLSITSQFVLLSRLLFGEFPVHLRFGTDYFFEALYLC